MWALLHVASTRWHRHRQPLLLLLLLLRRWRLLTRLLRQRPRPTQKGHPSPGSSGNTSKHSSTLVSLAEEVLLQPDVQASPLRRPRHPHMVLLE